MRVTFRCLAPLAHGSFGQQAGNATLIRRAPIVNLPGIPRVPTVSGNALRGVMRRNIMRELLSVAGLSRANVAPGTWDRLYAALANGGHLDGSETSVQPSAIRELRDGLPPLSLFGAALYSWMLPGHMSVGWLWPRCVETVQAGLAPASDGPLLPAEELVSEVSMCRHVDREDQDPAVSGVTPMPTTIEAMGVGTELHGTILLAPHASPVEVACLAHALRSVRTLGGKGGGGFGAVDLIAGPSQQDAELYQAWLRETRDLRDRIMRLADGIAAKPAAKTSKGKSKSATPVPADPEALPASLFGEHSETGA